MIDQRRGSTTVEMAILLPLLVVIMLLCVDFGRFAHFYIAVTNAARAGAGYAVLNPFSDATKPTWEANVRRAVEDELKGVTIDKDGMDVANRWFDPAKLTVSVSVAEGDGISFRPVTVNVSYPFETLVILNTPFSNLPMYNDSVVLRHEVVARMIR